MISNKHISEVAVILTTLTLVLCILAMVYNPQLSDMFGGNSYSMEYEEKIFDTSKITDINIIMDEDSWNTMLSNAMQETYYECDVEINGETFYRVGIRPKGNTSLSSIARDPENNRYSFKLEFDQFVDGQTCFGLDKLVLNNSYADATNMKEAIIYDMYRYLDADASLYNYAKISVNGEYWGVYLAVEAVEESFMLRNYGTKNGYLYKPDGMNRGRNDDEQGQGNMPRGGFGGGMFGMGSGGANLNYTDSNMDSYFAIWNGEINDSSENDHKRVVTALKNISDGMNLEKYLDTDNLLKYMAVHNFSVNDDSLSGNMAHNYYLYESGGKLNIIPWDYNLAFGGMRAGDASDIINDPIDDPYGSTQFFDALLENEEYKERYHEYYNKLIEGYCYGERLEETYKRIENQIDSLVETDPNSMYTYEEYTKATDMLYETLLLRAESVKGQLAGIIPSTSQGQREDSSSLIDASHIDVSAMGQFMGGGRGDFGRHSEAVLNQ